jgi:hypothetical protein
MENKREYFHKKESFVIVAIKARDRVYHLERAVYQTTFHDTVGGFMQI